jgi:glycosyltransferase involved in cell wall biosynthesis
MILDKKVVVVMPAYNAEKTLRITYEQIPKEVVDEIIVVDDASTDRTVDVARELGLSAIVHEENKGYGANQKTCYQESLKKGGDITVMLHPDYQYTPKLIPAMAYLIAVNEFDVVLGSRILGGKAMEGGMPFYKYVSNRFLTFFENLFLGEKLSEYHTGYRAFSKTVLEKLPLNENSDDFVFDNEMLAQIIYFKFRIGEVSCPAKYFKEASSINFKRSVVYGLGVLSTSIKYFLQKKRLKKFSIFDENGKKLEYERIVS